MPTADIFLETLYKGIQNMNKYNLIGVSILTAVISLPVLADMSHDGKVAMPMNKGDMQMMQGGGMGTMNPEMMKKKQKMMQKHMATMEQRLANIESLMKELVDLQKKK
jgi:ABC-type methionine transport system ATPase subunit